MSLPTPRALLVLTLLALPLCAQPTVMLQDLSLTTVATGLTHAGDLAVDGTGNVWILSTQGAVGGSGGNLTMVTPGGAVFPNAVTGISEVGDLVRGNDGNVYFWMNTGTATTSLAQLQPSGAVTLQGTWTGFRGAGIGQDSANNFYLGSRLAGQTGIWVLTPGAASPTFFAQGLQYGAPLHLSLNASAQILAGDGRRVELVTGPSSSTLFYLPPQMLCPLCDSDVPGFTIGPYGDLLTLSRTILIGLSANTSLLNVKGWLAQAPAVLFGTGNPAPLPAIAPGLLSDYYILDHGTLYRITGTPAILTPAWLPGSQFRLDLDASAGDPFVLAVDVQGLVFPVPGVGTFHTSLGTGPGFFVLLDGVGAFLPPDPAAITPWTQTWTLPSQTLNVQVTLEAYVLDSSAANGVFMISNFVDLWF